MKHIEYLNSLDACEKAVEWTSNYPTLQKAWDDCECGDWMLWILGKQSGEVGTKSRKKLVMVACQCARSSLKYVPKGEDRPRIAIETAEAYCKGNATLKDVKNAANAASDADDADADAAANAANAAADAANAAAAAGAARYKTLRQCAEIVRKYYPKIRMK